MRKYIYLLLMLSVLFSCGIGTNNEQKEKENRAAEKFIAQTIRGEMQSGNELSIRFVDDVVSEEELNKPLEARIFSFKPKIKGETYWNTTSTLVFKPASPLVFRKTYQGKLNFKALQSGLFPDSLTNYYFEFTVSGRAITAFDGDLKLANSNNPKFVNFQGEVSFSELVTPEEIKKAFEFAADGKIVNVSFQAKSDGNTFTFKSDELVRNDKTQNFVLKIDKKVLGLDADFEKSFQLTPLTEMQIVGVTMLTSSKNPKIRIEFSDELSSDQELAGLISIDPVTEHKLQKIGGNIIIDGEFRFGTEYKVTVHNGIKSRWSTQTKTTIEKTIKFPDIAPQVEFASSGVYLSSDNDYKIQFFTCNLQRVHIEIKKVYDKSLIEFLNSEKFNSQTNRRTPFNDNYINRTGVIIHNETFEIDGSKNKWLLSEVDLSNVIKRHQKGLYLVRLNFNPRDMLVASPEAEFKYIEENGQIYKPLIFSNIGLTCKKADGNYHVWATDLATLKPLENVSITLKKRYNHPKCEPIALTNSMGEAIIYPSSNCGSYYNYAIAEYNNETSAITFDEMEWNISGYDVGGIEDYELNTQAFCYTERGVYRPGDDINFSVIARHRSMAYPDNKTLSVDLFNPQGKKTYTVNSTQNKDGFYNFNFKTSESDPTGNWKAGFYIGNKYFTETVKIETIVPFRLKTVIKTEKEELFKIDTELNLGVDCKYLFGTPAKQNKAEVTAEINSVPRHFPKYLNFTFNNPTIDFNEKKVSLFDGKLNDEGKVDVNYPLPDFSHSPSAINLKIDVKILEKGGRPNHTIKNILINPYDRYVGIQSVDTYVKSGTDLDIPVVLVDTKGDAVPDKTLHYRIYRNENHWWWQYDQSQMLRFKSDFSTVLLKEGELTTGSDHTIIRFLPIENGSYFIEVADVDENGHSTGFFFSAYRYSYSSESDNNAGSLVLRSDKASYNTGETAHISFPTPTNGKVFVSVEQSDRILSSKWYSTKGSDEMVLDLPITETMVPNIHVSVSVIQPQSQTINDRPIRMFGIIPITVINPDSKYDIAISTADQFRPEEPFEVTVQTSNRSKGQFTIAVVDEGLLDITQFKTPEPWKFFFRKLRLRVRSYDLFSQVISANLGDVFKTFAIGGDIDYRKSQLDPTKKKRRFIPVSLFQGPIETDQNGRATVKFDMPNYVGSVRIMVVSANNKSYANAEKTVPVKKELMILPTLPRVIGPDEKFQLPVSVFAMIDNIGEVKVTVETVEPIKINGANSQTIHFDKMNDKECIFNLYTAKAIGQSKVVVTATNGKYTAKNEINLSVRPLSPRFFETTTNELVPSGSVKMHIPNKGVKGSNKATLTLTPFPGMNFGQRLKWLIHYPYGCVEQVTSSVFPQLYIKNFIKYPDSRVEEIDQNINAGIERLRRFQLFTGAFSYWPGRDDESDWGTLYAGHFMVEAKKLGYYVPVDLYNNWLKNTNQKAKSNEGGNAYRTYRCYILALAGQPVISEMNLLMESEISTLSNTQKWQLAAAYYLAGQTDVAKKISNQLNDEVNDYIEFSGTYGSSLRDKAIILDCKVAMKLDDQTTNLIKGISAHLASATPYSTQSLSYSILALGKYMDTMIKTADKPRIKGTVILPDGKKISFDDTKSIDLNINKDFGKDLEIQLDAETSFKKIYTLMNWNGVPLESDTISSSRNLALQVEWFNEDGGPIDPFTLKQGTSFWAHFHVNNISSMERVDEIALMFMLPSGWEVQNTRLNAEMLPAKFSSYKLNYEEYLDIRDDRVMWFFDLHRWDPLLNQMDFVLKLNTVTVGEFTMPTIITEAMYNASFSASVRSQRVRVIGIE